MGETNKTPEFLAKFPLGKVPALECADGFCMADGAAICQYLARMGPKAEQLLGNADDPKTQARISEWSFFSEGELISNFLPPAIMVFLKLAPFDETSYNKHLSNIERACGRIETALEGGKKYLVGDTVTLADIMVGGVLIPLFKTFADAEMRKNIPSTVAYVQNLADMEEFKNVYGALEMCETRARA